jgi:hypothetical protein
MKKSVLDVTRDPLALCLYKNKVRYIAVIVLFVTVLVIFLEYNRYVNKLQKSSMQKGANLWGKGKGWS